MCAGVGVAILGRLGRRPLPRCPGPNALSHRCCDPRPPRKTAAAGRPTGCLRSGSGCDSRPPRKTAAAPVPGSQCVVPPMLRSSAASEDGRCRKTDRMSEVRFRLRFSAASEDGRCRKTDRMSEVRFRLRFSAASEDGRCHNAALILEAHSGLRSSAASEDGRCRGCRRCTGSLGTCCDPRPPRKTAAARTRAALRSCRLEDGRCRARASGGGEVVRRCCDPRPPRKTAAATGWSRRRPRARGRLRSSAASEDGRCTGMSWPCRLFEAVAILGRLGRRPLLTGMVTARVPARRCDPRPPRKKAAAAGQCPCSKWSLRVAILGRLGRRPLPTDAV